MRRLIVLYDREKGWRFLTRPMKGPWKWIPSLHVWPVCDNTFRRCGTILGFLWLNIIADIVIGEDGE